MNKEVAKKAVKVAVLPGVIPRLRDLFGSGFGHLAIFIAQVFSSVRLLPRNHPYLNPANVGRFGLHHVVNEARRHLVFKWENSDQIIIYFTILLGLLMLALQIALLVFGLFTQAAHATLASYYASFFVTAAPDDDIAFMMLDRVFGLPGMFNSKVDTAAFDGPFPSPFHTGLHTLFAFYSYGVFAVGIILIIYFSIAIVGETAESGTPFGKRFNPWFGVRFILAIAALAPIHMGFNMGQLVTLRMAKYGSSVATNGWIYFNNALAGETLGGTPAELVARPNEPEATTLLEFMAVAKACKIGQDKMYNRTIEAYLVREGEAATPLVGTDFITAIGFTDNGNITVRFGVEDDTIYPLEKSHVAPLCGELTFTIVDVEEDGAMTLQEAYYNLIESYWTQFNMENAAENLALRVLPTMDKNPNALMPSQSYIDFQRTEFDDAVSDAIDDAILAQRGSAKWNADTTDRGWAGAAIWYNLIAQLNGGMIASARNLPFPSRYPDVMEHVRVQRSAADEKIDPKVRFLPYLSDGQMVEFDTPQDMYLAVYLYIQQAIWFDQAPIETTGNVLIDLVNAIFGTQGIFDIVENTNIHPLAQIVAIGRGLIESAIMNLGAAFVGFVGGGLGNILGAKWLGVLGSAVSGFSTKVAMIGLALGFILFYVVPFMPFLYFFFALGGWVKSIFEAMVGVPLWALSLIRIDGESVPGPNGMNGIWLVFEIFLRPILIIFGFLAAITIFAAMVKVLNEIWYEVVSNITGNDTSSTTATGTGSVEFFRGVVDQFFFTILYAIIVYLIGMSSFKLIDAIPNQMLRWMGQSVQTFQENDKSAPETIIRNLFGGTQAAMGQASGAFGSLLGRHG